MGGLCATMFRVLESLLVTPPTFLFFFRMSLDNGPLLFWRPFTNHLFVFTALNYTCQDSTAYCLRVH